MDKRTPSAVVVKSYCDNPAHRNRVEQRVGVRTVTINPALHPVLVCTRYDATPSPRQHPARRGTGTLSEPVGFSRTGRAPAGGLLVERPVRARLHVVRPEPGGRRETARGGRRGKRRARVFRTAGPVPYGHAQLEKR